MRYHATWSHGGRRLVSWASSAAALEGACISCIAIASIVFACTFGAALAGILCRSRLPDHHLSSDSKDVVRIGMGLIATMAALILGLVVASAKTAFDAQDGAVRSIAADVLTLDRTLAQYGAEATPVREQIRSSLAARIEQTWPSGEAPTASTRLAENAEVGILALTPENDAQRWLQSQALSIASDALDRIRTLRERHPDAVPRGRGLLAGGPVLELRAVRAEQRDGH